MRKIIILLSIFLLFLSIPGCKKKLPTSPDIPTTILPTIEYFKADPTEIVYGSSSMLSWSVKNATKVEIDQGIGVVSASGTSEVSPEETITYTLTATNNDGQKTKSCEIKVEEPISKLPVINYFYADPIEVDSGYSSTLSWSVTNSTDVIIENDYDGLIIDWIPSVGSIEVTLIETTQYQLLATNNDGHVTAHCTVTVNPAAYFIIDGLKRTYTTYGSPRFEGYVKNVGTDTGYNVKVAITCYSDLLITIIDVAYGFPANMGNIASGQRAYFEAIASNCNSHDEIKSYEVTITWLTVQGVSVTQSYKFYS